MPFASGQVKIDRSTLPAKFPLIGAHVDLQLVNKSKRSLVLYPDAEPGVEPFAVRYVGAFKIMLGETVDKDLNIVSLEGLGQLVITRQRVLGLITDSTPRSAIRLNEDTGSVYVFGFDWDDVGEVMVKKGWFGRPSTAAISGKEEPFGIVIIDIYLLVKDNGDVTRAGLSALVERLASEGRITS
jgi:hypothetical protein